MSIRAVPLFAAILAWAPASGLAQTTVVFPSVANAGGGADLGMQTSRNRLRYERR